MNKAEYQCVGAEWFAVVKLRLGPFATPAEARAAVDELAPGVKHKDEPLTTFAARVLTPCPGAFVRIDELLAARSGKEPITRQVRAAAKQLTAAGYMVGHKPGLSVGNMTMTGETPGAPLVLVWDEDGDPRLTVGSFS